ISYSSDDPARAASGASYGFTTHIFIDSLGIPVTYYLHVPQHYNPVAPYPLVLVLHGTGERGRVKNSPAANRQIILEQHYVNVWTSAGIQQQWPSFVVIPQITGAGRWVDLPTGTGTYQMAAQPSAQLLAAKEIVDALQLRYG